MSNEEAQQEKRGFKVEDRRRFSETGEARETQAAEPREQPRPQQDQPAPATSPPHDATALPLTFATFVLSLSTQALVHLGEIPNPADNRLATDLPAAKQMIDILGILKEKTTGNLDSSESGLLDGVLYDLRLRYVESVRKRA
ncbi:MAG: hypothetical protein H6Q33_2702 [Deltaproteobacteria bacterium]|nr:hypothetical protein [Deltaproteobacteria bacterium]